MHARCFVIFVDRQHGRLFAYDTSEGQVELLAEVYDTVPKSVKAASWKGLADDKVSRHVEEHVFVHYKRVVEAFRSQLDATNEPIFLAGQDENIAQFTEQLPTADQGRVAGHFQADGREPIKDFSARVGEALLGWQQAEMHRLLAEVENNRGPDGKGVVGREAVMEALSLRQVQSLFINPRQDFAGYVCNTDGFVSSLMSTCPTCQTELAQQSSITLDLIALAKRQAASVIAVSEPELLKDYDSLAALRRYS